MFIVTMQYPGSVALRYWTGEGAKWSTNPAAAAQFESQRAARLRWTLRGPSGDAPVQRFVQVVEA